MGYFPNGSEWDDYYASLCTRCEHDKDGECPIIALHFLWNYDAVGKDKDEDKEHALDSFIPKMKGACGNEKCKMFLERKDAEPPILEYLEATAKPVIG